MKPYYMKKESNDLKDIRK